MIIEILIGMLLAIGAMCIGYGVGVQQTTIENNSFRIKICKGGPECCRAHKQS